MILEIAVHITDQLGIKLKVVSRNIIKLVRLEGGDSHEHVDTVHLEFEFVIKLLLENSYASALRLFGKV